MRHYVDLREEWESIKDTNVPACQTDNAKIAAKRLGVQQKDVIEYAPDVFVRRTDFERVANVDDQHFFDEIRRGIASDHDGHGYIFEMFVYELIDRDYQLGDELTGLLSGVGIAPSELRENKALANGLIAAISHVTGQPVEITIRSKDTDTNGNKA
ncbi:MAG TPA: hypothetical protein PL100_01055 [Bacillota bacterium]|jgi:hypothetical protein|nr:hypothetical protein [Bacillota bacterium]HQC48103.1 hypothetical protein [Bacillota bacterium]